MPGSTPPTSQLDWLISTTAMIVLFWSRATRDLLKSFGWGIRRSISLKAATMVPFRRRLPHSISPLEQMRFERSVRAADNAFEIVLFSYSGVSVPARNNNSTERDQRFESGFLQRRV